MFMAFAVLLYMIRSFVRTERSLHLADIEREKIGSELRIASNIQKAMIAINDKSYSIRDDLTLCGSLDPAKEVGGDFYYAFIRNEKLFFCIGDVSGKGVPSAIIMAVAHALFRSIAQKEDNPSHIMNALNTSGCQNNKTNIFTTMFIGVLDLPTGHLRYCNAGHEIPLIIKKEDGNCTISKLDVMPNLPIGLFDDFKYVMQKEAISHGTTLFLYTDGLTEARNLQHEQFGMSRLEELLTRLNTNDPQLLINGVKEAVEQFTEGAEQSDDLTILTFHYAPKEEEYLFTDHLTLQNDVREVAQLNSFVKGAMEQLGIEKPFARKLQLAVEEAVVNVIDYAYPAGKVGNIDVKVTSNGHQLRFIITDEGIAFNPTEASQVDTTLSAEERPVGGLGILLVRELMDSVNYERVDGKNILTLCKEMENKKVIN
jgi:sigma-B regulation protein RsbU (phosphoserine phosphatase)